MLENLNLRNRILVGYAVPLLVAIGMIAAVYLNVKEAEDRVRQIQAVQRVLTEIKDLERATADIQRSVRGYIIVKNDRSLKSHAEAEKSFETHSERLRDLVEDPEQRERLRKIVELWSEVDKVIEEEIALVNEGKKDKAVELFGQDKSFQQRDRARALIDDFEEREAEIVREKQTRQIEAIDRLYTTILAGTVLFFVFAGGSSLWIARFVGTRVSDTTTALLIAATEISSTVSQHERTAAQQASSVEEATATVEELSASSRQSAEQASAASANTEKASKQTGEGATAVKQAMAGMERLGEKVGVIADQVLRLGEQASQIGSIASLVRDLAGQTNMLALNAAVEAARAGEQGKGFAVVASEVRKLADQSKKSAEQAALLVANVQKAIDSTIMMTEEGTKAVEDGTHLTRQIGALFDSLSAGSENVYRNAKQVMLNGQQQSSALGQMVETINSINLGAKETVAGISQTKIAIQKVDEAARNLKALV